MTAHGDGGGALLPDDVQSFLRRHGGADLRESQRRSSKARSWNAVLHGEPILEGSHGQLPYQPLRSADIDLKTIDRDGEMTPFKDTFWATSPDVQTSLDLTTGFDLTKDNRVRWVHNGESLKSLLELVEESQKFILLNVLSVACDEMTTPLFEALERKAAAGVDVRLIVNEKYAWLAPFCLSRLSKNGIHVLRAPTHASSFVNDRGTLLIGAQSLARMFFKSDGFNGLDRDSMLEIKGPVATDAWADFITTWERSRGSSDPDSADLVQAVKLQRTTEKKSGSRGLTAIPPGDPKGLCRFISQHPGDNHPLEKAWHGLATQSRIRITLTGVKITETSYLIPLLREKSLSNVRVDYLGNGRDGGNGELTMLLDEWIGALTTSPIPALAKPLEFFRDADRDKKAREHDQSYRAILAGSQMTIWMHSGFIHHKIWTFDDWGVYAGSANVDISELGSTDQAGALCLDTDTAKEYRRVFLRDQTNSVPIEDGFR